MKRLIVSIIYIVLFAAGAKVEIYAETINYSVNGNGDGSENQVSTTVDATTNVSQENTADVNSSVNTDINTGDNNASSNTDGNTTINTGDAASNTNVNNENINLNAASDNSTPTNINGEISNNGSDSTNTINTNIQNNLNVNQTNQANITNEASAQLNTGNNSANDNNGDVSIKTGDAESKIKILNRDINQSINEIRGFELGDVKFVIDGNGEGSENEVNFDFEINRLINSENIANILNKVKCDVNTGDNDANDNNGDVDVKTGDAECLVAIINEKINRNVAVIGEEEEKKPEEEKKKEEEEKKPVVPPPSKAGPGGAPGGEGKPEVKGVSAAVGEVLPVTGTPWMFLATLLSIMMFLLGWYLRLRSGTSPPAKLAI